MEFWYNLIEGGQYFGRKIRSFRCDATDNFDDVGVISIKFKIHDHKIHML